MYTDKERLLQVIATVIERSRLSADPERRLTRSILLQRMNMRRPSYAQMSRDEFQNYFTTRPDRKSMIPVEDIVCLVEVILQVSPDSITASEVLALCDAARLPLREFRRLSRFFSIVEWNNAWREYDAAKLNAHPEDMSFIGREHLITQVLAHINYGETVLLCGESGVGKTQLALKACRLVDEQVYRVFMVDGRHIEDIDTFVKQLSRVMDVAPIGNESLLQRLQFYVEHTAVVVFLDDILFESLKETCGFLAHVRQLFPTIRILATTVQFMESQRYSDKIHVYKVPGLDFEQSVTLFRHICLQLGFLPRENQMIHTQIGRCMGNPMAIKMTAYMLSAHADRIEYDVPLQRVLSTLTPAELKILQTLYVFDGYVSVALLYHVAFESTESESAAFAMIHGLVSKGLVLMRDYAFVAIHALVRVWFRSFTPNHEQWRMDVLQSLNSIQDDNQQYGYWISGLQRSDVYLVLQVVGEAMPYPQLQPIAMQVLCGWRQYWVAVGYSAEVYQSIRLVAPNHIDHNVAMLLLEASLLRQEGKLDQCRELLVALEVSGMLKHDMVTIAKAKYEMAMTYVLLGNVSIVDMYFQQAEKLFASLQMQSWLAQIAIDRASVLVHMGESEQALYWSMQSLSAHADALPMLYIDAQRHRIRLLAYAQMCRFDMGMEAYQHAKVCFDQLVMPQYLLEIEIYRMFLWMQADHPVEVMQCFQYIMQILPRNIRTHQLLLLNDIVMLYLCDSAAYDDFALLWCVSRHLYEAHQLTRPRFLQVMLQERWRITETMNIWEPPVSQGMSSVSSYELIAHIRRCMHDVFATASK